MNRGFGNRDFGKHDDKRRALIEPRIPKSRHNYVNLKPFLEETKLIRVLKLRFQCIGKSGIGVS
jgi:hypothetical protein